MSSDGSHRRVRYIAGRVRARQQSPHQRGRAGRGHARHPRGLHDDRFVVVLAGTSLPFSARRSCRRRRNRSGACRRLGVGRGGRRHETSRFRFGPHQQLRRLRARDRVHLRRGCVDRRPRLHHTRQSAHDRRVSTLPSGERRPRRSRHQTPPTTRVRRPHAGWSSPTPVKPSMSSTQSVTVTHDGHVGPGEPTTRRNGHFEACWPWRHHD